MVNVMKDRIRCQPDIVDLINIIVQTDKPYERRRAQMAVVFLIWKEDETFKHLVTPSVS